MTCQNEGQDLQTNITQHCSKNPSSQKKDHSRSSKNQAVKKITTIQAVKNITQHCSKNKQSNTNHSKLLQKQAVKTYHSRSSTNQAVKKYHLYRGVLSQNGSSDKGVCLGLGPEKISMSCVGPRPDLASMATEMASEASTKSLEPKWLLR